MYNWCRTDRRFCSGYALQRYATTSPPGLCQYPRCGLLAKRLLSPIDFRLGAFRTDSSVAMTTGRGVQSFWISVWPSHSPSVFHIVGWFILGGGTTERSCCSPHYVNTERDYERDYQATLPQGRTAADGCKPRHGRDDRKRERSFSGLRFLCPQNVNF